MTVANYNSLFFFFFGLSAKKRRGHSLNHLPLLWWYPAGKFSECSLDWHNLFFGTDLVSVSKQIMTEKKLLCGRKKTYNL